MVDPLFCFAKKFNPIMRETVSLLVKTSGLGLKTSVRI